MITSIQKRPFLQQLLFLVLSGFLWGVISSPYNHEMHWLLFFIPLLTIPLTIPFFLASFNYGGKKKFWALWLWGGSATFAKTLWLINVTIEGKWGFVILALILLSLFLGLWYTFTGYLNSFLKQKFPKMWSFLFPLLWVVIDYLKSAGELSFPWYLQGYLLTPYRGIAQFASLTGIWGLTWIMVYASTLLYMRVVERKPRIVQERAYIALVIILTLWGQFRISGTDLSKTFDVALIQSNLDHKHWDRDTSLDNALSLSDSMIEVASNSKPDLIVLPESGVYTYLDRRWRRKQTVLAWGEKYQVPIMMGTLHFDKLTPPDSGYKVYNSAFMLYPGKRAFEKYHKMKLVPVSEGMPYGWKFPILSRIKIPGGSFSRGFESTVWQIDDSVAIAPTICYEAIYPGFNRMRAGDSVDALVNITNDSWFGLSRGPYQHAEMARLRAVELGVPVVRCAASGVSMVVDPYGSVVKKSKLGTRDVLISSVPQRLDGTLYKRFGDWFVYLSVVILFIASIRRTVTGKRTNSNE